MHNFVVHSNESMCRKMWRLGLDQVTRYDAIKVSSEDDVATVEHILKLMKPHTEIFFALNRKLLKCSQNKSEV